MEEKYYTSMGEMRRENALRKKTEKQVVDSFMKDLVKWVINETDINPEKGIIQSAKDYCAMHDVEYNAQTIEPLLFAELIDK